MAWENKVLKFVVPCCTAFHTTSFLTFIPVKAVSNREIPVLDGIGKTFYPRKGRNRPQELPFITQKRPKVNLKMGTCILLPYISGSFFPIVLI
jgi:hypothetical protein